MCVCVSQNDKNEKSPKNHNEEAIKNNAWMQHFHYITTTTIVSNKKENNIIFGVCVCCVDEARRVHQEQKMGMENNKIAINFLFSFFFVSFCVVHGHTQAFCPNNAAFFGIC